MRNSRHIFCLSSLVIMREQSLFHYRCTCWLSCKHFVHKNHVWQNWKCGLHFYISIDRILKMVPTVLTSETTQSQCVSKTSQEQIVSNFPLALWQPSLCSRPQDTSQNILIESNDRDYIFLSGWCLIFSPLVCIIFLPPQPILPSC